jgi:glycosyltransferase involved in cell wall biosynthesis
LRALTVQANAGDVLFCFNSLPPLSRPHCRVINYVHAPHFAGLHRGIRYSRITTLRMAVERLWFRLGVRNCDDVWVQTPTMAAAIRAVHPGVKVTVVPFLDVDMPAVLPAPDGTSPTPAAQYTFFYPADQVGHKNHINLLAAWILLRKEGLGPRLELTLTDSELEHCLSRVDELGLPLSVVALGRLPRAGVLERMRASSALLFPSLAETLGIPLLEASALGVPLLAAERDFVRDVCAPVETFDPTSPRSIADAVRRFMCAGRRPVGCLSPAVLAARLLE